MKELKISKKLKNTVISGLLLSIGMVLPMLTSQIKEIGDTLLPMHIPVMLCGLICGWKFGLCVGLILPLFRSLIFSMPPMYPNSVWMALELGTYGLVIGILYSRVKKRNTVNLYLCLITAMVSGRIVWGIAKTLLLGLNEKTFTVQAFIVGGFVDALPGIILQLVLIPLIMSIIVKAERTGRNNN